MRRITSVGWGLCLVALALPAAAGQPRRVSLTGNVSGPRAEGIVRARVKFSDDQTGAVVARATTDALGRYSVTLPRGKYDVEVVPASEVYVPTTIQDQVVAGAQILDLALPRMDDALYDFEVVGASGAPLIPRWNDWQVCDSFYAGFDPIDGLGVVHPAANTSGDGIWTLAAVPGVYNVSVNVNSCADTSAAGGFDFLYGQLLSTRTVPGTGPERLNIGGHRVTGRVVDESGIALAGQFLTVQSTLRDSHAEWNAYDSATTDANGEFEITVGDSGFFQFADSELTWLVDLPFAAPPSEPVELVLPNSVDHTVRVSGPGGVPIFSGSCSFAYVDLTRTDGATRVSKQVDTDGAAQLLLPAGTYTGSLSFYGCGYLSAPLPDSFIGTRLASESLPTESVEEWQLPTHLVTGTVKDENGEPYNDIFVIAEMTSVSDGWEASLRDDHYTSFNGEFQLSLMNGTGTLNVAGKLVPFDTSDPSTLDVVVPRKVPFEIDAGPIDGACNRGFGEVTLTPTAANSDLTTEYASSSGRITGSAQPGQYGVRAALYPECYEAYPTQDWVFESREPVTLPTDALPSLDVTPIELQVSLQEADGRPLEGSVSLTSRGSNEHWNITARTNVEGLLDQPLTLLTIPGEAEVFLFVNYWGQEHILLGEIGSQSIVITAQSVAEASAAVALAAGESVGTDYEADGANFGDRVETTLTASTAGTVRIIEGAIDIAAPNNFVFIAQQVSVSAPAGTASSPLQLDFEVDASSFEGSAPNDVQVFNEGDRVAACRGRNGRATPDPCISERGTTEAGNLELRVLTSHAGRWNFGVRTAR